MSWPDVRVTDRRFPIADCCTLKIMTFHREEARKERRFLKLFDEFLSALCGAIAIQYAPGESFLNT